MSSQADKGAKGALKQEIKRITKARKSLPTEDYEGKAALSSELKAVKKALHALESAPPPPPMQQTNAKPSDKLSLTFSEDFTISSETDGWQAFVENSQCSHYHDLRWREVFETEMERETRYLTARDTRGQVIGVLPIALTRSRLFGHYGVSLPYVNYGSAAAIGDNIESALIRYAFEQANSWDLSHIEIRDTKPREEFAARMDKVCMVLDLSDIDSGEQLLSAVGSKVRAQAKKALRSGITFEVGSIDLLDAYYAVFARNMRDLGTPVYAKSFFASLLESFPKETNLVVGRYQGSPVSAAFLLQDGEKWEIPWASTIRSANRIGANMALYTSVLQTVIERGAIEFDFGRSTVDSPTYKFKKQWRALPRQLYWYYSNPEFANALTPGHRKFDLAIRAWKILPVSVANFLGPAIVRNLP